VSPCQDERLERPNSPERHQGDEPRIGAYDALAGFLLQRQIVAQQATAVCRLVLGLRDALRRRLLGHRGVGPDLAVRMGVAAPHDGALVLKDLYIGDIGARADLGVLLGPHVHHAPDVAEFHLRQR